MRHILFLITLWAFSPLVWGQDQWYIERIDTTTTIDTVWFESVFTNSEKVQVWLTPEELSVFKRFIDHLKVNDTGIFVIDAPVKIEVVGDSLLSYGLSINYTNPKYECDTIKRYNDSVRLDTLGPDPLYDCDTMPRWERVLD